MRRVDYGTTFGLFVRHRARVGNKGIDMTGSNRAGTPGALIVVGMGVGAALTGCATDDSAAQSGPRPVRPRRALKRPARRAVNAKFAADFVVADQQIVTKKGPARVAALTPGPKLVCADSSMAQRLKKFSDAGKIETIKYLPDNDDCPRHP